MKPGVWRRKRRETCCVVFCDEWWARSYIPHSISGWVSFKILKSKNFFSEEQERDWSKGTFNLLYSFFYRFAWVCFWFASGCVRVLLASLLIGLRLCSTCAWYHIQNANNCSLRFVSLSLSFLLFSCSSPNQTTTTVNRRAETKCWLQWKFQVTERKRYRSLVKRTLGKIQQRLLASSVVRWMTYAEQRYHARKMLSLLTRKMERKKKSGSEFFCISSFLLLFFSSRWFFISIFFFARYREKFSSMALVLTKHCVGSNGGQGIRSGAFVFVLTNHSTILNTLNLTVCPSLRPSLFFFFSLCFSLFFFTKLFLLFTHTIYAHRRWSDVKSSSNDQWTPCYIVSCCPRY